MSKEQGFMEPQTRIKSLVDQANALQIDKTIPIRRYYRSGKEMVRMAHCYEDDRNYESAFILYMKFMTLFLEKIREHPEFSSYNCIEKTTNTKFLKEILPKAEKIKDILKRKYQQDYLDLVADQKKREAELAKEKQELENLRRQEEARRDELKEKEVSYNIKVIPNDQTQNGGIEDPSITNMMYPSEGSSNAAFSQDTSSDIIPIMPDRHLKPQLNNALQPHFDRSQKPSSLLSGAHKGGLRTVVVPQCLITQFLSLAQSNTQHNIETCGILAGKISQNRLCISHLIVPKQVGNADSCVTQHEEEIYEQQDKYDIITIGWIHTHPTQTAFLSSVDLHAHCSYQLMMPEAIAIVCAPKYNETGFFTLTPHYGLDYIHNCKQDGFHPHPTTPPLFEECSHVSLEANCDTKVVDLRSL